MPARTLATASATLLALATGLGSAPAAVAAPPTNAIGTVDVVCDTGHFDVTVQLTHRGPVELRVFELDSPTATTGVDSDHTWFHGSGSDQFTGSLVGGSGRYVDVHMGKADHHAGAVVDVATPVRVGPFSCPAP